MNEIEKRTILAMSKIYCRRRHGADSALCVECHQLLTYAHNRLEKCPYGSGKPTCAACPIHCYAPAQREAIKRVMREAGPFMLTRHPWLTLWHATVNVRRRWFRRQPTGHRKTPGRLLE